MSRWVAIDVAIGDNPKVWRFAGALFGPIRGKMADLVLPAAAGHITMLLGSIKIHAPSGDVSDVPDDLIELWAKWRGARGLFASAWRKEFAPDGNVNDWEEWNGRLVRQQEAERERWHRRQLRGDSGGGSGGGNAETPAAPTYLPTNLKEKPKGAPTPRADKAAPWMADIRPIYRERYDADPPSRLVKELRPAVEKHGIDEVVRRLRVYCERTEGRFFDGGRFVATWGEWDGSASKLNGNGKHDPAAAWYALLIEHGLLNASRDQFRATVSRLVSEGVIPDEAEFMAQCKRVSWTELRNQSAERFAVAYVREHLFPSRGVA